MASGFSIEGLADALRATLVAALAAFLFAQILTAAHDASHGDEDHDGHAPVCILCLAKAGAGEKLAAAAVAFCVVTLAFGVARAPRARVILYRAPLNAACPRGPPLR